MIFQIFNKTAEIHFDHNGVDDFDGYDGTYEDVEVSDEDVYSAVEDMIINSYFRGIHKPENRIALKSSIHSLLSDLEVHYSAVELFHDELRHKFEREANNG